MKQNIPLTLPKSPLVRGFPGVSDGKESACNWGDPGSIPGLGRFPWRRGWQPSPRFLPEESHGQRSLVGYSPWGHKQLDVTEQLTLTHWPLVKKLMFPSAFGVSKGSIKNPVGCWLAELVW